MILYCRDREKILYRRSKIVMLPRPKCMFMQKIQNESNQSGYGKCLNVYGRMYEDAYSIL